MNPSPVADTRSAAQLYADSIAYRNYADARVRLLDAQPVCVLHADGTLEWNFHEGQSRMMESPKRFIIGLGGRQSGKSETGPPWMYEEMQARGPGWYMVVAPTFPILEDSALPKFLRLFEQFLHLGVLRQNPLRFIISKEGERHLWGHAQATQSIVRFGHGTNASSLEAKTALACWVDEGGQREFKQESYEAIEGRLTTTLGRLLITTTPYDLGTLKMRFFDPWVKAGRNHPEIDVIQFKSIMNPAFPRGEYDRLKGTMPGWRHAMFYDGEFSVPAGLIYDFIKEQEDEIVIQPEEFDANPEHPRFVGLDFGEVNTAALIAKQDPDTGTIYFYRGYHPGEHRRVIEHVDAIQFLAGAGVHIDRAVGGAKSEGDWREEFWEAGLNVEEPSIRDIAVGIQRVYGLFAAGKIRVVSNQEPTMQRFWEEIYDYRYETDPNTGDVLPGMKIVEQNRYHYMDSMRYLCTIFGEVLRDFQLARGGGNRTSVEEYNNLHSRLVLPEEKQPHPADTAFARAGHTRNSLKIQRALQLFRK